MNHRPGAPRAAAPTPAEPVLDVLSFNIRHGEGTDGVLDLDRIAAVIRSTGADVVGLQEVDRHFGDRTAWADQATALARLTGHHLAYGVNLDLDPPSPGLPRMQYGTALLSRYPIVRWDNTHLHRSPGEEQRGLLHSEIDVSGLAVHVYITHLEFYSPADRARQAQQLVELIGDTRPAVLLGDFNAPPHSPEIALLRTRFTDAWTAGHRPEPATFPAHAPDECIDYVFAGPGLTPLWTTAVTTAPSASDHLPVLTRLALGRP